MNRARARFTKSFEDFAEQWLHTFNLPAASDVRRLREQLSRLERTVERMSKQVEDRAEAEAEPPPRAAPKAKPKPQPKPKPKHDSAGGG